MALLESLASLPAPDKLPRIHSIANECGIPEIWRRATLSPLEDGFLMLFATIISNPEKEWIRTLGVFLGSHGWKVDLRGSPKKHPIELKDRIRGEIIDGIKAHLKPGFDLKLTEKKKRGISTDNEEIEKKLRKLKYSAAMIRAIMKGRNLDNAACYYYWMKRERKKRPKSILNSYRQYLKIKATDTPR